MVTKPADRDTIPQSSYNIRQRDISVFEIAYHRAVAVTVGVVWAAVVSRYWWPAEARRELSRALGEYVYRYFHVGR